MNILVPRDEQYIISKIYAKQTNRPYRLFTFEPMASFPCLPVLARQACAWRLHLMFPARICCFFILSPITNLSLNVLCTKHEDWCHTKTRLLGQKWINGKVYSPCSTYWKSIKRNKLLVPVHYRYSIHSSLTGGIFIYHRGLFSSFDPSPDGNRRSNVSYDVFNTS